MSGPVFFVAPNAWDEPAIWRVVPGGEPKHCLGSHLVDPELWDLIVGAVRQQQRAG